MLSKVEIHTTKDKFTIDAMEDENVLHLRDDFRNQESTVLTFALETGVSMDISKFQTVAIVVTPLDG